MKSGRRPDYVRFVITGGVIGLVIGLALAARTGSTEDYRASQVTLYLGVLLTMLGALAGGLLAVVLDGRRTAGKRRSKGRAA